MNGVFAIVVAGGFVDIVVVVVVVDGVLFEVVVDVVVFCAPASFASGGFVAEHYKKYIHRNIKIV